MRHILSRLGDLDAAEEHLHLSLDIHGLDRRRTRAIVLADLGGVRLRQGDVDGALATWREFIACADGIRSVKVRTAIDDMRTRLNRFHGMAKGRGFTFSEGVSAANPRVVNRQPTV